MAIVFIRTLIIYFSLLLAMRLMGKRQLGEMELSEFIVAVLIADLAAHPLQDIGIPMLNGLIPIFTLFCLEILISGATMKHIKLRGALYGKPSIIISRGKICQEEMRKNRFTLDELTQELRSQSVLDINSIEYAVLETNGQLSVVLTPAERPATAGQLGAAAQDTGYPSIVINDGRVIGDNLTRAGLDAAWLHKQLAAAKLCSPEKVYLMTVDDAKRVYIAPMEEGAK